MTHGDASAMMSRVVTPQTCCTVRWSRDRRWRIHEGRFPPGAPFAVSRDQRELPESDLESRDDELPVFLELLELEDWSRF
jgi:hypothetical protein